MAGSLMAGGGVFYHYVVLRPVIEQHQLASAERERKDKVAKTMGRQVRYESRMVAAVSGYDTNWSQACMSVMVQRKVSLKDCLADKVVMTNQFMGEPYCRRTYPETSFTADCQLPNATANAVNKMKANAESRCAAEARWALSD